MSEALVGSLEELILCVSILSSITVVSLGVCSMILYHAKQITEKDKLKIKHRKEKVWIMVEGRKVLQRKLKAKKEQHFSLEALEGEEDQEVGLLLLGVSDYYIIQQYYCFFVLFYRFISKSLWSLVNELKTKQPSGPIRDQCWGCDGRDWGMGICRGCRKAK